MTIDTKRLRDLASAATQPSPWTVREDTRGVDDRLCMVVDRDGMWVADCGNDDEHAAFIAAACPSTVLALLDMLDHWESRVRAAFYEMDCAHTERDNARWATDTQVKVSRAALTERDEARQQLAAMTAARDELHSMLLDRNDYCETPQPMCPRDCHRAAELRKVGHE